MAGPVTSKSDTTRSTPDPWPGQLVLKKERDEARRALHDAIEYITHKGLYAEYLAMTGKETPL